MIESAVEEKQKKFLKYLDKNYLYWSGAIGSKDEEIIPEYMLALKNTIEGLMTIIIFKLKRLESRDKLSKEEEKKKLLLRKTLALCFDLIKSVNNSKRDDAVTFYSMITKNFKEL